MLQDRATIVTGAGQGIGRAIALELAKAAHVVQDVAQVDRMVTETMRRTGSRGMAAYAAMTGDDTWQARAWTRDFSFVQR